MSVGGIVVAVFVMLFCPHNVWGQIYSVRSSPQTIDLDISEIDYAPRMYFYAGPILSFQSLHEGDDGTASDLAYGLSAGAHVYVTQRLSIGAEGQYFSHSHLNIPFMDSMKQSAFYALARYNLAPDVHPSLWFETGIGQMETSFKLELYQGRKSKLCSAVFFAGIGTMLDFGRGWRTGLSLRMLYIQRTDFDFLFHYASHLGAQSTLFLSKSF